MLTVNCSGTHFEVLAHTLHGLGMDYEAIYSMGLMSDPLVQYIVQEHFDTYLKLARENQDYLTGLIQDTGEVLSAAYFLQTVVRKWTRDLTMVSSKNMESFDYEVIIRKHWKQTLLELDGNTDYTDIKISSHNREPI